MQRATLRALGVLFVSLRRQKSTAANPSHLVKTSDRRRDSGFGLEGARGLELCFVRLLASSTGTLWRRQWVLCWFSQNSICVELVGRITRYQTKIQWATSVCAEIDCLTSLALCAMEGKYCRPNLTEENIISIKNGMLWMVVTEKAQTSLKAPLFRASWFRTGKEAFVGSAVGVNELFRSSDALN